MCYYYMTYMQYEKKIQSKPGNHTVDTYRLWWNQTQKEIRVTMDTEIANVQATSRPVAVKNSSIIVQWML